MAYRPNGVPVTNVQGLPMVGYNGMQMGQPVTMMMQPTMIQLPMRTMGHQMTMVRPMATNMGMASKLYLFQLFYTPFFYKDFTSVKF